jgi:hypothetical protein
MIRGGKACSSTDYSILSVVNEKERVGNCGQTMKLVPLLVHEGLGIFFFVSSFSLPVSNGSCRSLVTAETGNRRYVSVWPLHVYLA